MVHQCQLFICLLHVACCRCRAKIFQSEKLIPIWFDISLLFNLSLFQLATFLSSLLNGSSRRLSYASIASLCMSNSLYRVAKRERTFTKVGANEIAIEAEDNASTYLCRACSHAHILDKNIAWSMGESTAHKPNASL